MSQDLEGKLEDAIIDIVCKGCEVEGEEDKEPCDDCPGQALINEIMENIKAIILTGREQVCYNRVRLE